MAGRTVVVGAGLAGLSAAIHLAAAGREVVVVEADTTHANLPSQRVMERAGMRCYDRNDQLRFYRVP